MYKPGDWKRVDVYSDPKFGFWQSYVDGYNANLWESVALTFKGCADGWHELVKAIKQL